jgi:hypothetical protein
VKELFVKHSYIIDRYKMDKYLLKRKAPDVPEEMNWKEEIHYNPCKRKLIEKYHSHIKECKTKLLG